MITTNSNFDAANALLGKSPIYVFSIGGQATVYTTVYSLLGAGITGTLPTNKGYLKTPQGASQTINIQEGTSTIGQLECEVLNINGEILTLVGGTTLEGQTATLKVGYPGMAYTDFVTLHSYRLYKIIPKKDYTSYLFSSRDWQTSVKRTVATHPLNGGALSGANPWILQGTPAEIVQAVILQALQRPVTEIDRTALAALDSAAEGLYKCVRPFLFVITEAFEAKQFLETEIYKPCGLYPVIDNLGRLSLRSFRAPAAAPSSVFTFSQDNCTVLPAIDRQEIVNEILFRIDDDGSGNFGNTLIFVDATSLSAFGRGTQRVIESKGLKSSLGAQWFAEEYANRMFKRFGGDPASLRGGAMILDIEAFLLTLPVWAGDYVALTNALTPDLTSGTLGLTGRLMEVIDREPDYANGKMRYKLLDTGLTGLAAAHLVSSSARDFLIESSEVY